MTKTLIIMSHPEVAQSSSQQFLLAAIKGEEQIQIRHLESILAEQDNNHFDKRIERACLQEADRIILQFPFYWYQCPSVMKQWMDEVLTLNLSQKNKEKELGIVVIVGAKKERYTAGGSVGFGIEELLRPYQALANQLGWEYQTPFVIYQFQYLPETQKQQLLVDYLYYLENGSHHFGEKEKWMLERMTNYENTYTQQVREWIVELKQEREELVMMLSEMGNEADGF
ncbi:NAD(P)H-dependent oxidoreductase [uncultured Granulicatella sp.]|uniref:NAD(P)H-dependent oxidoreductase n=1 Tax=uncultured Granulicatella sp. TaxID=316089 RepID=UPI0028D64B3C|nr:NAD(P)H-dependent oxidoreductase [uncultured Granulicatella sp.]